MKKHFTLEQAERLLPALQQGLPKLQAAQRAVELLEEKESARISGGLQ